MRDRPALSGLAPALFATIGLSCGRSGPAQAIRLIDVFDARSVEGSPPKAMSAAPRTEWRFDGPPPSPVPTPLGATRGWEAGPSVAGFGVRDGALVGRTSDGFPVLHVERTTGLESGDQLHAIEIRLRASAGANVSVAWRGSATVDLRQEAEVGVRGVAWTASTPLLPGDEPHTYTITPALPVSSARLRHLLIRPTDAAGADFAIESVRLVFEREHLGGVPSGASWQGLRDVFRETLVTRTPETVRFRLTLPSRPVLDLALGTPEDEPVTFKLGVSRGSAEAALMSHTLTTSSRWEPRILDLAEFAGSSVTLSLSATAEKPGTLAFWGAPAVRQRVSRAEGKAPPQAVILIQGDTLRTDHLDSYGYGRPTAPRLRRLADEGALFRNAVTQTSWTKAATPSVLTSLYASSHGVHKIPDRLPASATTIAEAFRAAGYATLSLSSIPFTGQFTNLHQGFEVVHESESAAGRAGPRGSKTAREYVDRLAEWLDEHRDVPFFVFLHLFDPHSPYEPNRPFDTLWADPKQRDEYLRQQEVVKKFIADPFLAQRGMATREELASAGLDPEAFIRHSQDWYDGSIRGMDTEIGRMVERLRELGLGERTLLAFYADHGEEFHDHGRMWHGQSLYGEMVRVPLILWAPGRIPKGVKLEPTVELIDVMPTLLELSGVPVPKAAQGRSLLPLLAETGGGAAGGAWKPAPAFTEKQPMGGDDFPNAGESYAVVDGDWKLIRNVARAPGKPEFELFDFHKDPLDQRDLSGGHPEVVERLARRLDEWRKRAQAARLKPDGEAAGSLSADQLERLRSLGYVR